MGILVLSSCLYLCFYIYISQFLSIIFLSNKFTLKKFYTKYRPRPYPFLFRSSHWKSFEDGTPVDNYGCPIFKWVVETSGWFNRKIPSYQYRKSHCGDKTILRPSYLHNGISYTGKMTSLYWIKAQTTCPLLSSLTAILSYGSVSPIVSRADLRLSDIDRLASRRTDARTWGDVDNHSRSNCKWKRVITNSHALYCVN